MRSTTLTLTTGALLAGLAVPLGAQDGARMAEQMRDERARMARYEADARTETAPAPWLEQDPADSIYQEARQALSRREYDRAARLFRDIRRLHRDSGYAPDSFYFEALALYRAGGAERFEEASNLLDQQRERYPQAATRADADQLRLRVRSQLARGGDAESMAELTQAAQVGCDSEDQDLRATALSALLQMNAERAVPILREVLQSRDACSVELRRRAVFLVSQKMGDETVDILLDLAHRNPDPDQEVREQAVFWLSQVRSEEALDALEAILRDGDEALKERAIFSISQQRSQRAVQILHDYAERETAPKELRERAIFWIGQSSRAGGTQYLRELYGRLTDPDLKERVIFGIAQSSDEANRAWLIERALDTSEPVEVRKNALFWAGQVGAVQVAELRRIYDTVDDSELKEQVIFVLSQRRGTEAVDMLMEIASSDEDRELRQRAVFWLGQSKDPRAAEFLLRLIRGGGK